MKVLKLAIFAVAALLGSNALGQSASDNLAVSATVPGTCTITANSVAFGTYNPVTTHATTPLNQTGTIGITCTNGSTGITVDLGLGANASGTTRRMLGGTSGEFLTYELYHPSGTTAGAACAFPAATVWGDGVNGTAFGPDDASWDGTAKSFNVCGTIASGQNVAADSYTDTVVATVNF